MEERKKPEMSDLQSAMNQAVAGFVEQVTAIARAAAIDTLKNALGAPSPRIGTSSGKRSSGTRKKRTSEDLDSLAVTFRAFVAKHPGLRIEQINRQIGTSTKDLALPIRKLIAEGMLKTSGEKRSTLYFVSAGSER